MGFYKLMTVCLSNSKLRKYLHNSFHASLLLKCGCVVNVNEQLEYFPSPSFKSQHKIVHVKVL